MPRIKWLAKDIPAKCGAINGKRTVWQFDGVPNLALDCLPNGDRVWRCRYVLRIASKRIDRAIALGQLGARVDQLLPGTARDRRDAIMARVAKGEDPFHDERVRASSPTAGDTANSFGTLFRDWIEQHAKKHKKTWEQDVDLHRRYLASRLDHRPVSEITRLEIGNVLDEIAKTTPRTADLATDLLSSMWNWAIDGGRADVNPAARQRARHAGKPRTKVLTDDELARVWHALGGRERGHQMARAIKLLILTGARINEVIGAEKIEVSADIWTKPAIRMKNADPHVVPLTATAKQLFAEAAGASEASGSSNIFAGRTGSGRETFDPRACSRATREIMKLLGIKASAHDFRRTLATRLSEMGTPDDIIERLLSHRGGRKTVTGMHYNHNDKLPEKRRALELWERRVLAIVAGLPASAERW
jgi:integrase